MEELLKKLHFKAGQAIVLGAPEGYHLGIESADADASSKYDFVQLFVNNAAELDDNLLKAIDLLKDDAVFWITYPKQSSKAKSDLNRDILWELVQNKAPYRPVSNVAVDDKWSALRFRHQDKVKAKSTK